MNEVILIKTGEIVLKGLNRRTFEDILIKTIRYRLKDLGEFKIKNAQSTIYVSAKDENIDLDEVSNRIGKIFGITAYSRACVTEKNIDEIKNAVVEYLENQINNAKTFKVNAKRSDKKFSMNSPEICTEVGGFVLEKFPHITVDVHNPDLIITVEVRDYGAYIRGGTLRGAGGIPIGTGGKAAILISGGIDSPVAAWTMAKRGIELTAVHFASPPYTSQRAEEKVVSLLEKVSEYSGRMKMFTVPFTRIQEEIQAKCPEELFTIIMRRFMMTIAERIAKNNDCSALITGESLGQVASQTIGAIACTDNAASMPVFRPLIGMDKEEIITIARKIDTFDISIQPYEDCCTVFTPKHPRTKPVLKYVKEAESLLDCENLINEAIENVKITKINF